MEMTDRPSFIEHLEIKNYGSNELTETDMWILTNASQNAEYLDNKLREADELSLDTEAPSEESEEELTLDTPSTDTELTLDTPSEETTSTPTEGEGEAELTLDTPSEETTSTPTEGEAEGEIETSKEGIGILPLLGEIQEKLANGKPSEVELAALKAIKKLVG